MLTCDIICDVISNCCVSATNLEQFTIWVRHIGNVKYKYANGKTVCKILFV